VSPVASKDTLYVFVFSGIISFSTLSILLIMGIEVGFIWREK
jgi:hypothetical protein